MTAKTNTNGTSEGKIRIIQAEGVQEQSTEQLDGEITIDLASEGGPRISTALRSEERPQVVVQTADTEMQDSRDGFPGQHTDSYVGAHESFRWLPVVGTLHFLIATVVAAVMGPQIWGVGASPLGELVVRIGHIWLFGISLAGTLWMSNDSTSRQEADADWQPSVTRYMIGGAGCLAAFGGAFFAMQGIPLLELIVAVTGLFILGIPMSSIFAGPVYIYIAARHDEEPDR